MKLEKITGPLAAPGYHIGKFWIIQYCRYPGKRHSWHVHDTRKSIHGPCTFWQAYRFARDIEV